MKTVLLSIQVIVLDWRLEGTVSLKEIGLAAHQNVLLEFAVHIAVYLSGLGSQTDISVQ